MPATTAGASRTCCRRSSRWRTSIAAARSCTAWAARSTSIRAGSPRPCTGRSRPPRPSSASRSNDDCNGERQEGFSYVQYAVRDDRRQSATVAYLDAIRSHPGLTVALRAHARRVLIDGDRAVGVEFEQDGRLRRADAGHEVLLSAGTIESPRLLMLSGIGPADDLRALGIDVVADLPGVGGNLHDHVLAPIIFAAERPIDPPPPGRWAAESHLFWHSRRGLAVPDIQPIQFSVPAYEPWMEGPPNGFTFLGGIVRPASRGRLRLRSADPHDELAIDPRVLSAPGDVEALRAAAVLCRAMGAT